MVARWNPFIDFAPVLGGMDRFLSEVRPATGWVAPSRPAIDLYDVGDHLVVKAMMPGVRPEDLDVSIEQNTLHLSGTFGYQPGGDENKSITWYRREIGSGRFSQDVTLPTPVDADGVDATFEDGILTLTMSKAEQARVKRIEIKSPHALTA